GLRRIAITKDGQHLRYGLLALPNRGFVDRGFNHATVIGADARACEWIARELTAAPVGDVVRASSHEVIVRVIAVVGRIEGVVVRIRISRLSARDPRAAGSVVVHVAGKRDQVVAKARDLRSSGHVDGRSGEIAERRASPVEGVVVNLEPALATVALDT